jgi:hypothetical protein
MVGEKIQDPTGEFQDIGVSERSTVVTRNSKEKFLDY